MCPAEIGTRNLLPLIAAAPEEIIGLETAFAGDLAPASELPLPVAAQPAMQSVADLAPPGQEHEPAWHESGGNPATMLIKSAPSSIDAPDISDVSGGAADAFHAISVSVAQNVPALKLHVVTQRGDIGGRENEQDGQSRQDGDDSLGSIRPHDAEFPEIDHGHSVSVAQIAVVDQDASIIVSGYVGEVVARLYIDQDLAMFQDVNIAFTIDSDGHFALLLDQDTHIDQEIEIDVKIFDVDGVLHVDVFLRDSIAIEQDTTIDMQIIDGAPGGTVEISQDIEFEQDVDIEIDIEDELEERYIVNVTVDVIQDVDADQEAAVEITDRNGQIDMDVDSVQTAAVDQETIIQAEFALA